MRLALVLILLTGLSLVAAPVFAQDSAENQHSPFERTLRPIDDPFDPEPPDEDAENDERAGRDMAERVGSDRIYLEDGSLLDGRLTGYARGELRIAVASLGEVGVDPDRVVRYSLARDRVFYLQERPGTESRAVVVSVGVGGQLTLREANAGFEQPFRYDEIHRLRATPIPAGTWTVEGRLASALSYGNSESLSLGFDVRTNRFSRRETVEFEVGFLFSEFERRVTQRLMRAQARYRYFPFEAVGGLVETRLRKDEFAGVDFRSITTLGLVLRPSYEPTQHMLFSLSLSYSFENLVESSHNYLGVEAALALRYDFTTTLGLRGEAWFNVNLNDDERWKFRAMAELRMAIVDAFGFHLRVENLWMGKAPEGFRRNDLRLLGVLSFAIQL